MDFRQVPALGANSAMRVFNPFASFVNLATVVFHCRIERIKPLVSVACALFPSSHAHGEEPELQIFGIIAKVFGHPHLRADYSHAVNVPVALVRKGIERGTFHIRFYQGTAGPDGRTRGQRRRTRPPRRRTGNIIRTIGNDRARLSVRGLQKI